jgi:hypothetical protein
LVWGYAVRIQLYRQLVIGVTEKHVREVHRPFNRFDDKGPHADPNVAFAWQSGHRPIARALNYGLDGAFPTQLQPALLQAYEWVSMRWHEFLGQGSKSTAQPAPLSEGASSTQPVNHYIASVPGISQAHDPPTLLSPARGLPTSLTNHSASPVPFIEHLCAEPRIISNTTTPLISQFHPPSSIPHSDRDSDLPHGALLFQMLDGLPVIICKACQHGVWPFEIVRHLKSNVHRIKHAEAVQIQEAVQQWEGVAPSPDAVVIPHQVDEAFPGLPTYLDGLLCRREFPGCQYIGRSLDNMRRHWRTVHGWSQYTRGGRIRREERIQQEAELRRSYVIVTCQRIFPSRKGSHYIHVHGGTEEEPHIPVRADQVDQAVDEVVHAYRTQEAEMGQRVEAGDINDANSWLRVTGWPRYFYEYTSYKELRDIVMTPEEDSADPLEQGVRRIWHAMDAVVWKSQRTVQYTGQAIRIESVRSEKGQTPYRPLQAYLDAESIAKHVHPWQQILAFFARTQAPHTWKTPRQRKKWQQLWQYATARATSPDPAGEQDVDPKFAPWIMTDIKRACLEFCIELMNQTYHAQEYESPLVCAMAVLGRGEIGWRDPESYPPILSAVIKVARFMIVQKALWLDPDVMRIIEIWQEPQNCATWALRSAAVLDDLDHDSAYGSSEETPDPPSWPITSPFPRGELHPQIDASPPHGSGRCKTLQEQVTWMVSQLMVRGRHMPMETLQEWRDCAKTPQRQDHRTPRFGPHLHSACLNFEA